MSGTLLLRGSTLLYSVTTVIIVLLQNLNKMITVSPDRIRVTQRWSSAVSRRNASTTRFHGTFLSGAFAQLTLLFYVLSVNNSILDCSTLFSFCKVLINVHSRIYIFYRFRMDMGRYVQPSCLQQRCRTSSALSKDASWSLHQK